MAKLKTNKNDIGTNRGFEATSSFGNGLFAVPICALWES